MPIPFFQAGIEQVMGQGAKPEALLDPESAVSESLNSSIVSAVSLRSYTPHNNWVEKKIGGGPRPIF